MTDPALLRSLVSPPTGAALRVAVTGHCELGDAATVVFVAEAFETLLRQLRHTHAAGIVALSGLAPGADTIFAEVALGLGLPLEACIAATEVLEKYAPGPAREQHLRLRARSRYVHELPFVNRSGAAYLALGHWLVHTCDLLIAAWNGQAARKPGGTGDVVALARRRGRPVIHIHPLQRTISTLTAG